MAERQLSVHWLKKYLAAILAAGVAAITVTALTVTTVTIDGSGDYLNLTPFSLARDVTIPTTTSVLSVGEQGATLRAGAAGDDVLISAIDEATMSADGGGVVRVSPSLTSVTAPSAGDDILIDAADDLTVNTGDDIFIDAAADMELDAVSTLTFEAANASFTAPEWSVNTGSPDFADMALGATGFSVDIDAAGDDIVLTTADTATIASDNGGQFQTNAGGATMVAISTGDDITIDADDQLILDSTATTMSVLSGSTKYRVTPSHSLVIPSPAAPATTAETVMASALIEAGTLTANGRGLEVWLWGTAASNTNSKTVRIELATTAATSGTTLIECNFSNANSIRWEMRAVIYRTGSNTQLGAGQARAGTSVQVADECHMSTTAALTDSANIYAVITAQNATTAADLSINGVRFTWL